MKDIHVNIPDFNGNDPATGKSYYEMLRANRNWKPGKDHPTIPAEALPVHIFEVKNLVNAVFNNPSALVDKTVIQFLARKTAVDFREYTGESGSYRFGVDDATGKMIKNPKTPIPNFPLTPTSLFFSTVHNCFAKHHRLGITPEALLYMVLHEVGICVKQNPAEYRDLFTTSPEKQQIEVMVNELGGPSNLDSPWHLGVKRIHTSLQKTVPAGALQWLLPGFSTDNLENTTANMIAVLDVVSSYYEFSMMTMCGIPSIRMFGEVEDYKKLIVSCQQLSERFNKHLGNYFKHLLPVLAKIHAQVSDTEPHDNEFWSSIYKHHSASGTNDADGWITAFLNYTFRQGIAEPKDETCYDWATSCTSTRTFSDGIPLDQLPTHMSSVPFTWKVFGGSYDCRLVGGFLGVENIEEYATPVLSYAVLRNTQK